MCRTENTFAATRRLLSRHSSRWFAVLLLTTSISLASLTFGQTTAISATGGLAPNLIGQMDRAMRYLPDGPDFVIENGSEFFNRPLYGRNTAFRVDAGDEPEFTLYLPGRGGNLRFGLRAGTAGTWLSDAAHVVTRYRPGSMLYEIRDPLLGTNGHLDLILLALNATDGLIVRAEAQSIPSNIELVWAYGGVNGERGARDGDIGTERVPISQYFQLKPEYCQDNAITLGEQSFILRSRATTIMGIVPAGAKMGLADATKWGSIDALFQPGGAAPQRPVVTGRVQLLSNQPLLLMLQRVADGAVAATELNTYSAVSTPRAGTTTAPATVSLLPPYGVQEMPRVFSEAETYFRNLRERVLVETPDPFINAAAGALNLAADAVWDEPQSVVMHGAIAWRARLLGWRGPYVMDELGWHDRARKHFTYWASQQNTDPIPERLPPADENANLSRSERGLHSNGDISNSHYDMNLVYIDALLRHLLWTGDMEFARKVWPVIERHLAWERRLFRREFGPEKLPLYEAYAAIWASDDLEYHGGGTTHASAYNYYHNKMAARLASQLGMDSSLYENEASLIAKAMRNELWLPDRGTFAEFKDLLGNQLVHPDAALWSFYHTVDSEVPTPQEAWRMAAAIDRDLPHLPVQGPGVPTDAAYYMLPSTDWMPYSWSINNVVMGENIHTALGYWKAGRSTEAFLLTKSALLASMYMGICPGNIGSMNYLDVYRRESQRDFGDGAGVLSRAIIEGLFGFKPDALAGEVQISPGLPSEWDHAKLTHPDVGLEFTHRGLDDRWAITLNGSRFRTVHLRLPAINEGVALVEVNGGAVHWTTDPQAVGRPLLEVSFPAEHISTLHIRWEGPAIHSPAIVKNPAVTFKRMEQGSFSWWAPTEASQSDAPVSVADAGMDWSKQRPDRKLEVVDLASHFNDRVTEIFKRGKYRSPRSPFVSLALPSQGIGAWAGHMATIAEIDDSGLRRTAAAHDGKLIMPNGVPFATPAVPGAANVIFTSQWDNYPRDATIPLTGHAAHAYFLMAGSTNHMQSRMGNGEVLVNYTDGTTARLALQNPTTWWPIDQDYFVDDFQFCITGPLPPRVNLRSGEIRLLKPQAFKGRGRAIPGGAATVLDLPLDPSKNLQSAVVRTIANEVVIGLMSMTLERP